MSTSTWYFMMLRLYLSFLSKRSWHRSQIKKNKPNLPLNLDEIDNIFFLDPSGLFFFDLEKLFLILHSLLMVGFQEHSMQLFSSFLIKLSLPFFSQNLTTSLM